MEQMIIEWMHGQLGYVSAVIGLPVLILVWLTKEPLSAWLTHRELKQKDTELLLSMLKDGHLSDAAKHVIVERLERDEIAKATGVSLKAWEREPLIRFVMAHARTIDWSDIKNARPQLRVMLDSSINVKKAWWMTAPVHWMSKGLNVFFALVAALTYIAGIYLYFQGAHWRQYGFWIAYAFVYLALAVFTKVGWVAVLDSYAKLRSCLSSTA